MQSEVEAQRARRFERPLSGPLRPSNSQLRIARNLARSLIESGPKDPDAHDLRVWVERVELRFPYVVDSTVLSVGIHSGRLATDSLSSIDSPQPDDSPLDP